MAVVKKKDDRGQFLTVMLVLHTLLGFVVVPSAFAALSAVPSGAFNASVIFTLLIAILYFVSVIFMWGLKKLGAYATLGLFLVWLAEFFILDYQDMRLSSSSMLPLDILVLYAILIYLAFGAIYFLAVKRKWHLFS